MSEKKSEGPGIENYFLGGVRVTKEEFDAAPLTLPGGKTIKAGDTIQGGDAPPRKAEAPRAPMPVLHPFEYVAPTPASVEAIKVVRKAMMDLHDLILSTMPASRERSLALTKLEESSMWANKGIVFSQPPQAPREYECKCNGTRMCGSCQERTPVLYKGLRFVVQDQDRRPMAAFADEVPARAFAAPIRNSRFTTLPPISPVQT